MEIIKTVIVKMVDLNDCKPRANNGLFRGNKGVFWERC